MEQSKLMATGEVSGLSAHSQSTFNSVTETLPALLFIDFISGHLTRHLPTPFLRLAFVGCLRKQSIPDNIHASKKKRFEQSQK